MIRVKYRSRSPRVRTWGLIFRYGVVAISITCTGTISGLVSVLGSGIALLLITRGDEGTSASVFTGIAAWIGCSSLISLLEDNSLAFFTSGITSLVLFSLGILKFWNLIKEIERSTSL
ncbi:MAG: hypothetical protein J7524_16860 [Roseofilum sp. Belize BBD 4]|uniref:hypothetical protein n=1 Tax=Roseofilum sp. Belize BBD 4 TaxID=2821500 RepID=UPI001B03D6B3|nr:hypothetical protein [Roseofilum sp. Belize BBD 4]MBP0034815.1 hypothetical protein [Roseofilum sp. Belize BBD 4]